MKCDVDVRKDLYGNIVMVSLPGFSVRLMPSLLCAHFCSPFSLVVPPCTPVSPTVCRRKSPPLLPRL
jgi:hypothetical protein